MKIAWIIIQILIGYNLILPVLFYLVWRPNSKKPDRPRSNRISVDPQIDYAVILTAYEQIDGISSAVDSILRSSHSNFLIYIVADNCDVSGLEFEDSRVILLRPPVVLASNTASHMYAVRHFQRRHTHITIVDSDNLVHPEYLVSLNASLSSGFIAVQGIRLAKNLNTNIACLDAARDCYYHFYDGLILYELGSSATLSGSGMAFQADYYTSFLENTQISGAGFDKVLQYHLVNDGHRIAFNIDAKIFDEKTTQDNQLVNQRARWINTWFRYARFGSRLLFKGILKFNINQLLFGLVLSRPPLFIFLILSCLCLTVNLFLSSIAALTWLGALGIFVIGFFLALSKMNAEERIYRSLFRVPKFVYLQVISLLLSGNANKRSVATKHYNAIEDSISNQHDES